MGPKSPYRRITPPTVFAIDVEGTLDAIARPFREAHPKGGTPSTDTLLKVFLEAWARYQSPRRKTKHPSMNAQTWALLEVKQFVAACATGRPDIKGTWFEYQHLLPKGKASKKDVIDDFIGGV